MLFVALFGLAKEAEAYEFERTNQGAPLWWPSDRAPEYFVDALAEREVRVAARFAFDLWGRHLAPEVRPEYRGLVSSQPSAAARDGESIVRVSTAWTYGSPERLVAYTELFYDPSTGEIAEVDISLNAEGFNFQAADPGSMDPKSVLVHEVGHFLGLAHSCGVPGSATPSCFSLPEESRARILGAIMAPSLGPGQVRVELGEDDLAGLQALYPGGFIQTSSIGLVAVEGTCEVGGLVVYGEALPDAPEVFLRRERGELSPVSVRERGPTRLLLSGLPARSSTESVDLLLVDPASRERVGLHDLDLAPAGCSVEPPPADEDPGCACRETHTEGSWLGILSAVLALLSIRRRRALTVVLTTLLLVSVGGEASAYRCSRVNFNEGPSLYWSERSIGFFVDDMLVADEALNLEFRQEITTSLAVWTSVDCSDFELSLLGFKAVRAGYNQTGDNENVITFVDATQGWAYDRAIIAVTTNTFETTTGRIIDSDIEVNDQNFDLVVVRGDSCDPDTGVMDLQNTLTHEVGHVIGLDHPPNTRVYAETTMFASAPSCETKKRTLTEDDMAGLCDIYPLGQPVAQCFPPNGPLFTVVEQDDGFGGCSVTGPESSAPTATELAMLLGLLGLGAWRGRRRRT